MNKQLTANSNDKQATSTIAGVSQIALIINNKFEKCMKKGKMTAPLFECAYSKCPKLNFFEVTYSPYNFSSSILIS